MTRKSRTDILRIEDLFWGKMGRLERGVKGDHNFYCSEMVCQCPKCSYNYTKRDYIARVSSVIIYVKLYMTNKKIEPNMLKKRSLVRHKKFQFNFTNNVLKKYLGFPLKPVLV